MPNKCISICNQFPEAECNPPRCKYINGQTRKYCRISHKYKTNKANCTVSRRIKKKDIETHAKIRIGKMIKSSKKFLNIVCPNSGVCTAFGNYTSELNTFFKGFTDFKLSNNPIRKLGEESDNGFVKEIEYEKEGYKAHAILKSTQKPDTDNLVYEYLVGIKFVNRIVKSFPCFIETYGLYFYDSIDSWKIMKGNGPVHKSNLNHLILQNNIDYVKACENSQYAAILIQHIQNAKEISQMINIPYFMSNDLVYVLFIVYQALSELSTTFTHYDLHYGNVLIYKPVPGKFIQYHYHNSDGSITSFYSPYIPKIIDYGRSFFDNGNLNSRKIYDKICSTKECEPECGGYYGLSWLDPKPQYFISSSKKNESHDLRMINSIKKFIKDLNIKETTISFKETKKVLNKLVYGIGIKEPEYKTFGTKENVSISESKIYNVTGAYIALKKVVENSKVILENQMKYSNLSNKLGDLHVYYDKRPMKYEANL